jgi:hypothetical protein
MVSGSRILFQQLMNGHSRTPWWTCCCCRWVELPQHQYAAVVHCLHIVCNRQPARTLPHSSHQFTCTTVVASAATASTHVPAQWTMRLSILQHRVLLPFRSAFCAVSGTLCLPPPPFMSNRCCLLCRLRRS